IESVRGALKLDEIWVVPTAQNPLREKVEGPSPQERFEMVQLALSGLNQGTDAYKVRDDEVQRGGVSYTVDTLTKFRKEDKTAEFFLILGADLLEGFSRWKDYKKILKSANLIFTTRPGAEIPKEKAQLPE